VLESEGDNELKSRYFQFMNLSQEQKDILQNAVINVLTIAKQLEPFMPETSKTIIDHFSNSHISALKPLFPRLPKE